MLLATMGVTFHEIEHELAAGDVVPWMAEAGHWLDRAAAAVAQRQADLQRFVPWIGLAASLGVFAPIALLSLALGWGIVGVWARPAPTPPRRAASPRTAGRVSHRTSATATVTYAWPVRAIHDSTTARWSAGW